ncbi:peptidylprolyl isomerase [Tunicatimonas pelagia]|uniref:peptidylprolyl isomerase n=1 Tax=Tunicatimonas pelagia TaxID=931531 RepID=UPI00266651FD|nr:peptidylprolyl isomerase [Tunicatimonas pelagia]WKN42378.1 peptidylprolyl isomerase [Tunicatimonas pelagia]
MTKLLPALIIIILASCTASTKEIAKYKVGQIVTTHGEMLIWLYDETPAHKASFVELANADYWDSLSFNRVIEGFVIQGGCPDTPEGFSDSPYLLSPEFREDLKHVYGAVGAGRDGNPDKLSAGCQFYIVHNKEGIPRLDGNYTIFGQVFKGLETLNKIATVETDSLDAPLALVSLDVNVIELTEAQLREHGFEIGKDLQ